MSGKTVLSVLDNPHVIARRLARDFHIQFRIFSEKISTITIKYVLFSKCINMVDRRTKFYEYKRWTKTTEIQWFQIDTVPCFEEAMFHLNRHVNSQNSYCYWPDKNQSWMKDYQIKALETQRMRWYRHATISPYNIISTYSIIYLFKLVK